METPRSTTRFTPTNCNSAKPRGIPPAIQKLLAALLFLIAIHHPAQAALYVSNMSNLWTQGGIGDIHNLFPGGNPYGTNIARFTTGGGTFRLDAITLEFYSGFYAPQWVNVQLFRHTAGGDVFLGNLGNPVLNPAPTQWPQVSNPASYTAFVDYSPLAQINLDPFSQYSVVTSMAANSPATAALLFTRSFAYTAPTDWVMGLTSSDNPYAFGENLVMGVYATLVPEPNSVALLFGGLILTVRIRKPRQVSATRTRY
jgi:hypothetical protein